MFDLVMRRSQREGEVGGMTEKGGVPLLRLPVWRIPKHGRVGESCDLSFLPSSGMLLVIAGMSRQQKAPMTRGRREGVQVDHSGRSWGSRPGATTSGILSGAGTTSRGFRLRYARPLPPDFHWRLSK